MIERRGDVAAAVVVWAAAMAAHLVVATSVPDTHPIADMGEYWERAVYIFEHGTLYESSFRTPGYPIAAALAFGIHGSPSLGAVRLLNTFAAGAAAVLTYCLARRTAQVRPSFVTAMSVALYPSFLMHTALVATEALVAAPLLAALLAVSYSGRRAAVVAGFCVGLSTLVRPSGIALLPVVLAVCARRMESDAPGRRRWGLASPLLALVTFCAVMSPWWLHTARLEGRFIPLDTGGGVNLMIGNGPEATGGYESSVLGPLVNAPDSRTSEGSDRLTSQAMAYVRAHPLRTMALVPKKVQRFLATEWRDPAFLYSWSYFGELRPALVWTAGTATVLAFPLVLILATAGLSVRHGVAPRVLLPSLLFVGTTIAMHVVLFGDARYHLPLVPVLAVLATGLSQWRNGVVAWRLIAGALLVGWIGMTVWTPQATWARELMPILAAPGGSALRLSYDNFLPHKR